MINVVIKHHVCFCHSSRGYAKRVVLSVRLGNLNKMENSIETSKRRKITMKMEDIKGVSIISMDNSQFVKPVRMVYTQNGVKKKWDMARIHDSVSILIFNTSRKVLVLVKQFRPAVYYAGLPDNLKKIGAEIDTKEYPVERGMTLELCAGIVDKDVSLEEVAKIEVMEECGYNVSASSLEKILTYRSGIGVTGDAQTLFYVEVTDEQKINKGGGNPEEGELIEVVELSVPEAKQYIESGTVLSPGGFIFALLWFLQHKAGI